MYTLRDQDTAWPAGGWGSLSDDSPVFLMCLTVKDFVLVCLEGALVAWAGDRCLYLVIFPKVPVPNTCFFYHP